MNAHSTCSTCGGEWDAKHDACPVCHADTDPSVLAARARLRSVFAEAYRREATGSEATGIEAEVCGDIAARQQLGRKKYGTTVAENPLLLDQWLEHGYQELLDGAIYLKRARKDAARARMAIEGMIRWCDDRRQAPDITTLGMVQEQLRGVLASFQPPDS